jgi:tagatose 1,6-diphosphate aldolase/sulfofructosephosphate aldolase
MSHAGLARLADDDGLFTILALDQRAMLGRMLSGAGLPSENSDRVAFKAEVTRVLAAETSGVLLDPEYGVTGLATQPDFTLPSALLIAAEPTVKDHWNTEYRTVLDPTRDAAWVRSLNGDALKFMLYWDPTRTAVPGEPDLVQESLDRVAEIVADCHRHDLPSVIEPLLTTPKVAGEEDRRLDTVVRSAAMLAQLKPSLLKLEWPGDATRCKQVTEALPDVPWALLSAGVAYEAFAERVAIALDSGASGVIAGRAIWGEAASLAGAARTAFLTDVALPRLQHLSTVMKGRGRDWREVVPS